MTDQTKNAQTQIFKNTDEAIIALMHSIHLVASPSIEDEEAIPEKLINDFKDLANTSNANDLLSAELVYKGIYMLLQKQDVAQKLFSVEPKGEA